MIHKITLDCIACYKNAISLETNKKINLIYGLNGTGKSTLSNYLYNYNHPDFSHCSIESLNENDEILVYNQTFVHDNFYESETLKGIFSLSKGNKEAKEKINEEEKKINILEGEKGEKENEKRGIEKNTIEKLNKAKEKIWEIKKNYTGGDRVLEFCLEGLKGSKEALFDYIVKKIKPQIQPTRTIEQIKEEVYTLTNENVQKYDEIIPIILTNREIENNAIFQKIIVGNKNSSVSALIDKLKNADWVKAGLKYISTEAKEESPVCPFCQQPTISQTLLNNIKEYFDEAYENDLDLLNNLLELYRNAINNIPAKTIFDNIPILQGLKKDFEIQYNKILSILNANIKSIEIKVQTPSIPITLTDSQPSLNALNDIINRANEIIKNFNEKIERKTKTLNSLKVEFWDITRWEYDQTISYTLFEKSKNEKQIEVIEKEIKILDKKISEHKILIKEQQKHVVNIDSAINNINMGLIDLGIEDFKIEKHSDDLYRIVRGDKKNSIFHSLSEGEKMIISFLYFLELCRGKKTAEDVSKKKIVVIDDPISSLSHIYIFNVGRLIQNEFLRSEKYEQIFILTHSLYFFYELTETKKERREEKQKLFRLQKNTYGSKITEMKYEEIQNDYHAYWNIIKDEHQQPALIANCMRNIIEYFFNFIEKTDLNNVFQKTSFQIPKFQAFNRYINRESHSLGQNIFDIKEFNYCDFKEAFALVFKETGYEKHFEKMMNFN